MSLDHLHPFAGQHAIQTAAFAIDFSTELDVGEIGRLRAASVEHLKADFPSIADQHRTVVSMTSNPGQPFAPGATTTDVGGFVLERLPASAQPGTGQSSRSVIVSRESIIVVVNDYTRWDKFKADVEKYISVLMKSINAQKGVSSIGLQISDVFVWKADPAELNAAEVFSDATRFLVSNALNPGAILWHSHHGYVEEKSEPLIYTQLNNVNVGRSIVNGEHQIQILTSHKATFGRALYKVLDANREKLLTVLNGLHIKNKEILANLLSHELQEKISLNMTKE